MYISGVPGTGKTATVKRVVDALNSDIIMKHSFKVIVLVYFNKSLYLQCTLTILIKAF